MPEAPQIDFANAEAWDRRMLDLYSHYVGGRITKGEFIEQAEALGPMRLGPSTLDHLAQQCTPMLAATAAE